MGYIVQAFDLPWYVLAHTCLNPQDVMFPLIERSRTPSVS